MIILINAVFSLVLPSLQELLHLSRDSLGAHVRSCTVYTFDTRPAAGPRAGSTDLWRLISSVAACLPGLRKLKAAWFDSPPDRPCRATLLWAPLRALHNLQDLHLAWPSPSDEAMQLDLQVRGAVHVCACDRLHNVPLLGGMQAKHACKPFDSAHGMFRGPTPCRGLVSWDPARVEWRPT